MNLMLRCSIFTNIGLAIFIVVLTAIPLLLYPLKLVDNKNEDRFAFMANMFGDTTGWIVVIVFFTWAYLWLLLSNKFHFGPVSKSGCAPIYKGHGELYYFSTVSIFLVLNWIYPNLCLVLYQNAGENIRSLNAFGLLFCAYLYCRSKHQIKRSRLTRNGADKKKCNNCVFDFFWGAELHPKLFWVDVKQLTVVRLGMMMWQLLILTYFLASIQINEVIDYGHLVSVILQSVYIFKTFHLESSVFLLIDMTHDRAGFYLCWGTIALQPALYPYSSYLYVKNVTNLSVSLALILVTLGLLFIRLNYDVFCQRKQFREGIRAGKNINIWGKPAHHLKVTYKVEDGGKKVTKTSYLLTSGWWGMSRKMNYLWEFLATLMWSLPGYRLGFLPFLYLVFLVIIFLVRVHREDKKCKEKYGKGWNEYCLKVPYRIVPYVY